MAGPEQITANKEVVSWLLVFPPLPPGKGVATRLSYGYDLGQVLGIWRQIKYSLYRVDQMAEWVKMLIVQT